MRKGEEVRKSQQRKPEEWPRRKESGEGQDQCLQEHDDQHPVLLVAQVK